MFYFQLCREDHCRSPGLEIFGLEVYALVVERCKAVVSSRFPEVQSFNLVLTDADNMTGTNQQHQAGHKCPGHEKFQFERSDTLVAIARVLVLVTWHVRSCGRCQCMEPLPRRVGDQLGTLSSP